MTIIIIYSNDYMSNMKQHSKSITSIFAPTIILILCTLDILTTYHVLVNSIGYESNVLISSLVVSSYFYFAKFIATILIVLGIAIFCRKDIKLKLASYLSIILFYTIVVLNNFAVILLHTDFGLNLPKLFLMLFVIFGFNYYFLNIKTGKSQSS